MKNDSGSDLNRFNAAEFCDFAKSLSMEIFRDAKGCGLTSRGAIPWAIGIAFNTA